VNSKAGFTTVVAVDFGPDGLLYALELSDAAGFPGLGQGKVVRVRHSDRRRGHGSQRAGRQKPHGSGNFDHAACP
jgi:hypothetical protein